MRWRLWGVGVIVALFVVPEVAMGQVRLGCYDMEAGPWQMPEGVDTGETPWEGGDSLVYALPTRVRLEAGWSGRGRGTFRMSVPEAVPQIPKSLLGWRLEDDSLRVVFSNGYSGVRGWLGRASTGWAGRAESFTDYQPSVNYRRDLALRPVPCDAPFGEPTGGSQRELHRGIPLVGGDSLVLERPFPEGIDVSVRESGAWEVHAQAEGEWSGADTLVVRTDSNGRIFHVELRYPEDHQLGELVEKLRADQGVPDSVPAGFGWANRTTRVWVTALRGGRVLLIDRRY